jgi:hypothetical protein
MIGDSDHWNGKKICDSKNKVLKIHDFIKLWILGNFASSSIPQMDFDLGVFKG